MASQSKSWFLPHLQRYLITGVLTVIPIWITWIIFNFILERLRNISLPWIDAAARLTESSMPLVSHWLTATLFRDVFAVLLTLFGLYSLGWLANRVVGKRFLDLVDRLIGRIPFIHTVYGSIKKLVAVLQQQPGTDVQRVVLIEFPSSDMKTIGLVTRTLKDERTGSELAAVYVPTTPNPTSGYLEIVPVENLISTDWTMEQAMTFIISGGAVAPERIRYSGVEPESRQDPID